MTDLHLAAAARKRLLARLQEDHGSQCEAAASAGPQHLRLSARAWSTGKVCTAARKRSWLVLSEATSEDEIGVAVEEIAAELHPG